MKKFLLLSLMFLVPASMAMADLKVAVIDLGKAFDGYYKTKEAQARLNQKKVSYQKDIDDMKAEYEHTAEEAQALQSAAEDTTLSPEARADKKKAYLAKAQDVQNIGAKLQETTSERTNELQDESFRLHKEIVDEIAKVVTDYSGPQGFDLVIDKSSASTTSGAPVVLYNSSKLIDITADILTKLNAGAPAPGATTPATPAPSGAATSTARPPAQP